MTTGYLITARLKSTRLKRKILLSIDEETVLDKVILRCKKTLGVDKVVLCTSINEEDAELVAYAEKHKIGFFRGSEDDVLKRLLDAAREFTIDRFLSITADNPLHSVLAAEKILEFDSNHKFDFIFTQNLPIGMSPYFIRTDALDVAVFMKEKSDTEIWGPFVNRPDFFNIGYLIFNNIKLSSSLRITCDYEKDYLFIKTLYSSFSTKFPDIHNIESTFFKNPEVFKINEGITQRMPDQETLNQINDAFVKSKAEGKRYCEEKGIIINMGLVKKEESI